MDWMEKLIDLEKMIRIRRRLHQYPETAFDLPRTLALVRQELAGSAIPFQEDLGKSSLVALINADLADQTASPPPARATAWAACSTCWQIACMVWSVSVLIVPFKVHLSAMRFVC